MAEIFPDEGLDIVLNVFPKNGTNYANLYLALFTSFTASTVGAASSVANDYVETDYASYARVTIAAADWGSPAAGTGGRKVATAQKTFPQATGASTSTLKGADVRDIAGTTGDKIVFAANFDDLVAAPVASGDTPRITPVMQYNN